MVRTIIRIDEEKCDGCGLCIAACHEGALGLVDGKARLLRDDYCDGLGNCLPACPQGALSFEEREAAAYDEAAVAAAQGKAVPAAVLPEFPLACGCPGTLSRSLADRGSVAAERPDSNFAAGPDGSSSMLRQWPVQIRLAPVKAAYFNGAHLLVAADCSAYACGSFHADFMRGRVTLIGCPKLDPVDYAAKLLEILRENTIASLTVARMSVPCCGGIEAAARQALVSCGRMMPLQVVTLSPEGMIVAGEGGQ